MRFFKVLTEKGSVEECFAEDQADMYFREDILTFPVTLHEATKQDFMNYNGFVSDDEYDFW